MGLLEVRYRPEEGEEVYVIHVGDGGVDHWLDTVRTAMMAAGYSLHDARRIVFDEHDAVRYIAPTR